MPDTNANAPAVTWWRRLARVIRRYPWLAALVQRIMRLWQPRFTAGVVGILFDESGERVLLVEHVFHALCPWGLPGGWMNRGEDPAHTAEREFFEETGLRVRAVRPLIVDLATELRGHFNMAFLCELDGAAEPVRLSHELLDYRWTPCDDLPTLVKFHRLGIEAAREVKLMEGKTWTTDV
jgi:8-oxo-dGTP pyrophosphatase MutT (NUDIX family)